MFFIKSKYNAVYRVLIAWLILISLISLILGYIYFAMQPIILRYAESVAETTMLNSANEAILKVFENNNYTYKDIAILNVDDSGNVKSIEINSYFANMLKSSVSNEISDIISERERYTVSIPVGTFLANTYTAGWGPDVDFKMQMTSTAFVDFCDEFKSVGINQVLHRITAKIKVTGSLIIAGYKRAISVDTSAIIAETVITGDVPGSYTNVIEEENDNTAGLINDYGAVGD